MESITEAETEESAERVCCPDDLCTGALDHEGRCGVCDRVFAQYARERAAPVRAEAASSEGEREIDGARDEEGEERSRDEAPVAGDSLPDAPSYREAPAREELELERECCDDDLCTGALGPDGVCGTCGRSSIKLKAESGAAVNESAERVGD